MNCCKCKNYCEERKGCEYFKPVSYYDEYRAKAKDYAEGTPVNNMPNGTAFGMFSECSELARCIYRIVEPKYKSYTKINRIMTEKEDVDTLFNIYKKIVDSYVEILKEAGKIKSEE